MIVGAYGIIFWMPLISQEMTALGEFRIGLLSALRPEDSPAYRPAGFTCFGKKRNTSGIAPMMIVP